MSAAILALTLGLLTLAPPAGSGTTGLLLSTIGLVLSALAAWYVITRPSDQAGRWARAIAVCGPLLAVLGVMQFV